MRNMIGFRNIAVRDYQALNLDIVGNIVLHRLDDFKNFASKAHKKIVIGLGQLKRLIE